MMRSALLGEIKLEKNMKFSSYKTSEEKDNFIINLFSRSDWQKEINLQDKEDPTGSEIDAIAEHIKDYHFKKEKAFCVEHLKYYKKITDTLKEMRKNPIQLFEKKPQMDLHQYVRYYCLINTSKNTSPYLLHQPSKIENINELHRKLLTNENFIAVICEKVVGQPKFMLWIKSGPFCYCIGGDLHRKNYGDGEDRTLYFLDKKGPLLLLRIQGRFKNNDVINLLDWFMPFNIYFSERELSVCPNTRKFRKILMQSTIITLSDKTREKLAYITKASTVTFEYIVQLKILLWEFSSEVNKFLTLYTGVNENVSTYYHHHLNLSKEKHWLFSSGKTLSSDFSQHTSILSSGASKHSINKGL